MKFAIGDILIQPGRRFPLLNALKVIGFNKDTHYYVDINNPMYTDKSHKKAFPKEALEEAYISCTWGDLAKIGELERLLYG